MDTTWPVRVLGTWPSSLRAVAIAVLVAVVIGGLTSPAQQYLPDLLRSLANAAGPWFVVIFVAVRLGRSPMVLAMLLGIAGFVLLNVSYGAVSTARGFPYSVLNVWTIVAIPAGVVVGLAATWLDSKRKLLVALGAAVPAVVLVIDGSYGLTVVLSTTGPVVWIFEILGAVGWMGWIWARRLRLGARS